MREELRNADAGRYLATTATGSHYLLWTQVFRNCGRDGETMELLLLESCGVGTPALIWLQVRADHIPTLRATSPVVLIEGLTVADQ